MPILHYLITGRPGTPDSPDATLSPSQALAKRGPVLEVKITVLPVVAQQLAQQGNPIPAPVHGLALIDTGANLTSVDDAVVKGLGISAVDVITMSSASHARVQAHVYPTGVTVTGSQINFNVLRAVGANLAPQGLLMLIGRDLLTHAVLIYNGGSGEFTIAT